jgi:hypothetical protein
VNGWSMRSFSGEDVMTPPGSLTQDLHLANGRVTGTVTSRLPFALTDGFVLWGDALQTFGRVGKGETVQVNVAVSSIPSSKRQPLALRLYQIRDPQLYQPPNSSTSAAQRETLRRAQIVTALFPDPRGGDGPVLVGWASTGAPTLKVNGSGADVRELTVVVMPLHAMPSAITSFLEEGVVTGRLVDLTGEGVTSVGVGLYFITGGAAIYELALPGDAWHNVRLRLSRNLGSYGSTYLMDVTLHNYRTGAWDALTLRVEGDVDVAVVPAPAAHLSPEGLLRVRFQSKAPTDAFVTLLSVVADRGAE